MVTLKLFVEACDLNSEGWRRGVQDHLTGTVKEMEISKERGHFDSTLCFLLLVLLDSLTKNEQSSNGHSQAQEPTNPSRRKMSADLPSANGEAGGDVSKGYTQDQVDAVKR